MEIKPLEPISADTLQLLKTIDESYKEALVLTGVTQLHEALQERLARPDSAPHPSASDQESST